MAPQIEEIHDDSAKSQTESDTENAISAPTGAEAKTTDESVGASSRNERKMLKMLEKLGLKPMKNVRKVDIKRPRQNPPVVNVTQCTVYHVPNSETYVVLGTIRLPDQVAQIQEVMRSMQPRVQPTEAAVKKPEAESAQHATEIDDDDGGYAEEDITMIVSQTKCTRAAAVAALKKAGGEVVDALMDVAQ